MDVDESLDVEHFHDYTVATPWERFVASLELRLQAWSTQEKKLHRRREQTAASHRFDSQITHRLPFRSDPYNFTLLLPATWPAETALSAANSSQLQPQYCAPDASTPSHAQQTSHQLPWLGQGSKVCVQHKLGDQPHKLQEWFGGTPVLLLAPASYSGRVLDEQEAHTLLSAASPALGHQQLSWPLVVPVQDAVRDAYQGVAVGPGGAAVHLESDSTHTSRLPLGLLQVDSQLGLFASRLDPACPASAALCRAALRGDVTSTLPRPASAAPALASPALAHSKGGGAAAAEGTLGGGLGLLVSVRRSFQVPWGTPGECSGVEPTLLPTPALPSSQPVSPRAASLPSTERLPRQLTATTHLSDRSPAPGA